jgi:hypothetical protein
MNIQKIKVPALILTSLVILSYGFLISAQEGYNSSSNIFSATDPAASTINSNTATLSAVSDDPNSLTNQVAQKLTDLTTSTDLSNTDGQQISIDKLNEIISGTVGQSISGNGLPAISADEIKIKKQDYKGSADKIKAKKKEDFINYIVGVYYIISSSFPKPITNSDDLSSMTNFMSQTVMTAITSRNSASLNDLANSGQKILDQLKDVEVPQDAVDIHTQALQFAKYAIALKPAVDMNSADPLADLVNLSKIENFAETIMSFSTAVTAKFNDYGITYDDNIKDKLKALGVTPPDIPDTATTTTTPTDSSSAVINAIMQ